MEERVKLLEQRMLILESQQSDQALNLITPKVDAAAKGVLSSMIAVAA